MSHRFVVPFVVQIAPAFKDFSSRPPSWWCTKFVADRHTHTLEVGPDKVPLLNLFVNDDNINPYNSSVRQQPPLALHLTNTSPTRGHKGPGMEYAMR